MSEKQMRIRGPKGTTKDSRIVVHVTGNPKTLDDPTREYWWMYTKCPTMGALIEAMHHYGVRHKALKMMTSDARRGYISLEGYDKNRVPFINLAGERQKHYGDALNEAVEDAAAKALYKDCTEGGAVAPVAP